jgi:uncharacterized protein YpuA (DUF1002 family)
MDNFKNYTNSELNIKLKTLENEYETYKTKALNIINNMKKLDIEYIKVQDELKKRKFNIW